jgi:cell division protein FtsQ
MTKKQKIFNLIIMIGIISSLIYLSFYLNGSSNQKIEIISFEGNIHLTKEQYFEFSNLTDRNLYSNLSLQIIKDRLEKHPYVENASVVYDGNGKVSIEIEEKDFESIVLLENQQFVLTDKLQILPVLQKTQKIDYPIISNPNWQNVKELHSARSNKDVVIASKIISGIKLLNPELYDALSSVEMQNGGEIILYFSSMDYPVVLGRGSEIKKLVYFNELWTFLKGKQLNGIMNQIDLRFSGHIYLGIQEASSEGEKKS